MTQAPPPSTTTTAAHAQTVRLTVLLVSYNTRHLLDECLAALDAARARMAGRSEVIVVDNASRDDSVAHLAAHHPGVRVLTSPTNVGFGRANNLALPWVQGEYLLLLNTDAFVAPEALVRTLDFMDAHPDVGVLGVRLEGRDGVLQPSCRYFPTPWNELVTGLGLQGWFPRTRLVDDMSWDHASVRDCDWVPGCYYLTRRAVVDRVGLFDPRYFLYCEEVDHCRAVKAAGWRVTYFAHTTVVHLGGESAASDAALNAVTRQVDLLQAESSLLYHRKHGGLAGLLQYLLLQTGMGLARAVKAGLGRSRPSRAQAHFRQLAAMWRLVWLTRAGLVPTR